MGIRRIKAAIDVDRPGVRTERALLFGLVMIFAAACGGDASRPGNKAINTKGTSTSPTAMQTSSPSPAAISTDSGTPENAAPAPDAGTLADRVNRLRQRVDSNPNATPLPLAFRRAPEDSRIAVSMEEDGSVLEVRIFDNHPELLKVEARPQASEATRFTITLKNGRTVAAKSDKIPNLLTATSSQFLELAGVRRPPADRPRITNGNR
ncbi:MAG: hypothetical protein WKF34_14040 [Pyrinomonadaceae bacterium]